ncbi:MAG: hypothetical protein A4S09_01255 [Proteobacteria bacterium SG_bin7]|nr:MAG: hypothetical protein A4S09_01255 [Proteobacteria bacterium SG_bin7]
MNIFEIENYKKIIKNRLLGFPKKGYGQLKKLATFLNVNTTFISQVVNGEKDFNLEQATLVCEFLGLSELESEYFLSLVSFDRAGNEPLRKFLKKQIASIRMKAEKLSQRLSVNAQIQEADKAIFYSDWIYSAIRQMTAVKGFHSLEAIAEKFQLSRKQVGEVMAFLLRTGLCKEENGKLQVGPSSTHLGAESPWVKSHHSNWRLRAIDVMSENANENLHYSSPMTLSLKDAQKIRAIIVSGIESVSKIVDDSPSEELFCFNVDWFRVVKK